MLLAPTALLPAHSATFAAAVSSAEASCPRAGIGGPSCSPFVPLGARCATTAVVAAAVAGASRSGGTGCASATQAEHLRALADLFLWLLLNRSGAKSATHAEHRMAARRSIEVARPWWLRQKGAFACL